MFIIRRSRVEDTGTLLKLARMVHFINLPPDESVIHGKILASRRSFLRVASEQYGTRLKLDRLVTRTSRTPKIGGYGGDTELFMFTLLDLDTGGVLGTSQVYARMGGAGNPNYYYRVEVEERFSESLKIGIKHQVARLEADESGPAEIGGLVLQPSYRGHPLKLGRFLSIVRFHFMGLYRSRFADRVLAEMMANIDARGDNLFWDAIGRKFLGVRYAEADQFCQFNREFIPELLPHGPIYLSLLPLKVQNEVGRVGPETETARGMLETLGFRHRGCIDPFDGGPYLDAPTDEIPVVRDTVSAPFGQAAAKTKLKRRGIVSHIDSDGEFFAVEDRFGVDGAGKLLVSREVAEVLHAQPDDKVGVTPLDGAPFGPDRPGSTKRGSPKTTRKSTKKSQRKGST